MAVITVTLVTTPMSMPTPSRPVLSPESLCRDACMSLLLTSSMAPTARLPLTNKHYHTSTATSHTTAATSAVQNSNHIVLTILIIFMTIKTK